MKNILKWDEFNIVSEKKKLDPDAAIRNRGDLVFCAEIEKLTDYKDHFPINTKTQARNALARASQYDKCPDWYDGSLKELVKKVHNAVKGKYPDIEVTEKSEKPGKD